MGSSGYTPRDAQLSQMAVLFLAFCETSTLISTVAASVYTHTNSKEVLPFPDIFASICSHFFKQKPF